MKSSSNLNISCKVVFSLNKWNKKVGSPSSFRRKRPLISLNSSASIENLSSSERANARARANHAKNDAQKGCAMQLNGITLKGVRANCICASLMHTQLTSRCHATSSIERARRWNVERHIALLSILISIHGLISLKCSILVDHFLYRLSAFCEKLKKILAVEVWFFSTFLPTPHRIPILF